MVRFRSPRLRFKFQTAAIKERNSGLSKGLSWSVWWIPAVTAWLSLLPLHFKKIKLEVYSFQVLGLSSVNDDS